MIAPRMLRRTVAGMTFDDSRSVWYTHVITGPQTARTALYETLNAVGIVPALFPTWSSLPPAAKVLRDSDLTSRISAREAALADYDTDAFRLPAVHTHRAAVPSGFLVVTLAGGPDEWPHLLVPRWSRRWPDLIWHSMVRTDLNHPSWCYLKAVGGSIMHEEDLAAEDRLALAVLTDGAGVLIPDVGEPGGPLAPRVLPQPQVRDFEAAMGLNATVAELGHVPLDGVGHNQPLLALRLDAFEHPPRAEAKGPRGLAHSA